MMIRSHVGAPTNPTHSSRHLLHVQDLSKHKRTISAPDFAPAEANRGPDALRTSMRPEGKAASESADEEIKCMYVENCDTNSSLRKAISHIFGRNKLCTRMIPAHVWVHYCRKHYQRSRYRNAQEYAKLQAELVQRQVMRIQAWSDCNKASGQGSVVSNWSISMRKREQNRVQEKSKKRSLTGESEEDDDCADRAVANGTAVPDWLREKCGEGYSTSEIEAITSRLKENVDNGTLAQIPDIEILPNISADSAEDGRSRSMSKRKPSTLVAHRRAQSVTIRVCPPVNDYPDRSAIHAIPFVRTSEAGEMFPARKRHRAGTASYNGFCYTTQDLVPPGQVHRPAPVTPLSYGLPHRPAVTSVLDNYCTSPYDENSPRHSGGYTPQRPALAVQQARLPFARPLSPPAGMDRSRRMSHGRSHSELSGFTYHSNEFTFRSPPPSHASPFTDRHRLASSYGYDATHLSPLEAHHQAPRSACEQGQGIHRLPPWTSQSSGGQVASDPAFFTLHRHARNLSTPVAFRESPPLGGSPYEQHACYQHA
ncbi:uncharacterized protein B0I36DRAFT_365893 [Microdochium trichocladiopsis]|uniref:ORP1 like protein n=1 Tax=Microdochium trichocladiopsis TaxID=1682393 RepID=A0A9P8Y2E5_9PEZI|nr:uncharacterized protein B0I36DRAFT_365893 [Microdochium trichocladiopsis]KAH7026309.1 hypothetical protein B0I36DRAFT_365893 [Microdochium trichocladiopsis]